MVGGEGEKIREDGPAVLGLTEELLEEENNGKGWSMALEPSSEGNVSEI